MMKLNKPNDESSERHPMDLKYMKFIKSTLTAVNCWPYHVFGENVKPLPFRSVYWLTFGWLTFVVATIAYVDANYRIKSFFDMGDSYIGVLLGMFALFRTTIPYFNSFGEAMKEFVQDMHLLHYRQKTNYSEQVYCYINKISSYLCTLVRVETYLSLSIFVTLPVYINFKRGMFSQDRPPGEEFAHCFDYNVPFLNHRTNLFGYMIVASINVIYNIDFRFLYLGFDLSMSVCVFHIWGHLKILDNSLRTLPKPNRMRDQQPGWSNDPLRYTQEENEKITVMLKDIINHHRSTIRFIAKVQKAFGPLVLTSVLYHQISGCLLLLECSKLESQALGRYLPGSVSILRQLVNMTVILELIHAKSETLKDAVYSIPWECMSISNQKMVLFLHMNVAEPISFKVMGIPVGVQTMATIIKTSISYFMFLRTLH